VACASSVERCRGIPRIRSGWIVPVASTRLVARGTQPPVMGGPVPLLSGQVGLDRVQGVGAEGLPAHPPDRGTLSPAILVPVRLCSGWHAGGVVMRAVVVMPPTKQGPNRTYAGCTCSMSVSEALEIDLPAARSASDAGGRSFPAACRPARTCSRHG